MTAKTDNDKRLGTLITADDDRDIVEVLNILSLNHEKPAGIFAICVAQLNLS